MTCRLDFACTGLTCLALSAARPANAKMGPPVPSAKKLIAFGCDRINTNELRRHVGQLARMSFDGIIITVWPDKHRTPGEPVTKSGRYARWFGPTKHQASAKVGPYAVQVLGGCPGRRAMAVRDYHRENPRAVDHGRHHLQAPDRVHLLARMRLGVGRSSGPNAARCTSAAPLRLSRSVSAACYTTRHRRLADHGSPV